MSRVVTGPAVIGDGAMLVGITISDDKTSTYSSYSATVTADGFFEATKGIVDNNNTCIVSGTMGSYNGSKSINVPTGGGRVTIDSRTVTLTATWDSAASATYGISLQGIDAVGSSLKCTVPAQTVTVSRRPTGTPTAPQSPNIQNIGQTECSVHFTNPADWQGPTAGRRFWIHVSTSSSFSNTVWSGNGNSATIISGLTANTKYYYRIRAEGVWWDGTKNGPFVTGSFTTAPRVPTLASTPAATSVARNSFVVPTATISDNGGQAPSKYRVQVNTTASETGASVYESSSWAAVTVGGRAPLTTYYYRVAAYNSSGWGPYTTTWASVTTLDAVPTDPAAPTMSEVTETGATVTWAHPALNGATLDNYLVRVCTGTDPEAYVASYTTAPTVTSQVVTGLTKGTDYNAFVKALATPTDSGWSAAGAFRTAGTLSTLFPFLKVAGVWKPVEVWARVGGVWQRLELGLKVDGIWKKESH